MIDNEVKERIAAEEIYRHEIRLDIEKGNRPSSIGGKLFTFLNTALGLWLLSSVLLSGLTYSVQRYNTNQSEIRNNIDKVNRLDLEISSRLRSSKIKTAKIKTESRKRTHYTQQGYITGIILGRPREDEVIYPEFEKRGLKSLVFEMSYLSHGASKDELSKVLIGLDSLKNKASPTLFANSEYFLSVLHDLESTIIIERWKD